MLLSALTASAQNYDFTEFSLDELMKVTINSVSRKEESLFDAPAAVHVISNEDIKRSGYTTLAGSLRMSPGMHVGRIDSNYTAVASRGFNDVSSNKLLVLMDGRSVYSPLFSGVNWTNQQMVMEDLDRIEIIRGPGAALWGSNAVNGVINITSKSAKDTVGTFASLLLGDHIDYQVVGRHGLDLGNDRYLRIYAKYSETEDAVLDSPLAYMDQPVQQGLAGFRYDWEGNDKGTLTIQGDFYRVESASIRKAFPLRFPDGYDAMFPQEHEGAYLLARWTHPAWEDGEFSFQGYVDYSGQDHFLYGEDYLVVDFEAEMRRHFGEQHEIVAGAGVRYYDDELTSSVVYGFDPASDSRWLFSTFVQDEIEIEKDKLDLIVGVKVEHTTYTQFEVQPNIRLLYRPDEQQAIWASVAQAARTPSRSERGARVVGAVSPPQGNSPMPTVSVWQATGDFDSEKLTAFEAGHRYSSGETFSFDSVIFYNQYRDLRGLEDAGLSLGSRPIPHHVHSSYPVNGIEGATYGAEFTANVKPATYVRVQGTASFLDYDLDSKPGLPNDFFIDRYAGLSPKTQLGLRAMIDLSEDWMLDIHSHYFSQLHHKYIDAYTALDIRFAWKPRPGLELSLVGRDLLKSEHEEFPPTLLGGDIRRIPRSFFLRANWDF